ncbi:DNA primase [Nakamurella sp. A5-74]|uniref:DNA primase n=1 Tax=Nakamurella sp. A5-74 TaxID=3158264 RepID=A0AAU8DU25_9ACTN
MAGRITDEDKERVRDANRIESVIGEYVALRPSGGGNLKGLCPFHDEKTPSFNVRPAQSSYYCFGCGEGGDVFSFIAQLEHLSFLEAVERLADRVGITLARVEGGTSTRSEPGTRARLIAANKAAAEFYSGQLETEEAAPARQFLTERAFDMEAARSFGCGYAPSGWDRLTKALVKQGFSLQELYKAGLAREGQRGPIDQFHRRLLWTIRDAAGDVVGFGARRLFDDDRIQAKYVNTSDTPLYKKSQVLYGLDLAKREIAKQRQAVIVEGYSDVMAMHLAGVTTAVASCGTAFGDEHISVLRRYLLDNDVIRGEVIYTFDGDAAGQKAALKAFDSDQRFAANTYVAIAPDGMDPCELRMQGGDAAVRALVDGRTNLFAFAIQTVLADYDLETPEGRVAATAATVPLVAGIKQERLRADYTRELAGRLGAETTDIQGLVRREIARQAAAQRSAAERGSAERGSAERGSAERGTSGRPGAGAAGDQASTDARAAATTFRRPDPQDRTSSVEREVLKMALQYPAMVAADYAEQVAGDSFTHPSYRAVHEAISATSGIGTSSGVVWTSRVAEQMPAGGLRSLVHELAVEPPRHGSGEPDSSYAGAVIAAMGERAAAADEKKLRSALLRAESAGDRARANALQADLGAVIRYRRALMELARGGAA